MKFLVWGTGKGAEENYKLFYKLRNWISDEIVGFVDNCREKWGTQFHGFTVIAPTDIMTTDFDALTIWVIDYEKEILEQIKNLGISTEKVKDIFENYKKELTRNYTDVKEQEIVEVLDIINKRHILDIYNYIPTKKQKDLHKVFLDEEAGLYYAMFEEKRCYLKKSWRDFISKNGEQFISSLWGEQDLNSPHLYEGGRIRVEEGDIIIDAGVCEGNFTLHHIDKISKAYLVECDPEWMEALRYTFKPYEDKVVFIEKFLSNHNDDKCVMIDSIVDGPVNFIKMDIEGEEINALKGAHRVLAENYDIRCAICSYHRHGDEQKIKEILDKSDFKSTTSRGYMLFTGDSYVLEHPELRHGIVRGIKRDKAGNTQQYLDLMNQWFILKQKNIAIDDYLEKNGWKSIAIYGMGIYGRHLVRELENSTKCNVKYGIDMKAQEPYREIEIYKPEQIQENVDVVINTIIYDDKIEQLIRGYINCPVINIDDLVFESYKD